MSPRHWGVNQGSKFFLVALFLLLTISVRISGGQKECESPECKTSSQRIVEMMDSRNHPCDDMYTFSCGRWRWEDIPTDTATWSPQQELANETEYRLREILEGNDDTIKGRKSSAVVKVKTFYRNCMAVDTPKNGWLQQIAELINKWGSWTVASPRGVKSFDATNWDFQTVLEEIHSVWATSFWRLSIYRNKNGVDLLHLFNEPPGELPGYVVDQESADKYINFMEKVAELLDGKDVGQKVFDIFNVEKTLAELPGQYCGKEPIFIKTYTMTLAEFVSEFGGWFDWSRYFRKVYNGDVIKPTDNIRVEAPNYFFCLMSFINQTDKELLANYMMWRVLLSTLPLISKQFSAAKSVFDSYQYGTEGMAERWRHCVRISQKTLGLATGALYAHHHFTADRKAKVTSVLEEVKSQFISLLENSKWLDDITREAMTEKAKTLTLHAAYPEEILDVTKLDKRYEDIVMEEGNFLNNLLNFQRSERIREGKNIPEPFERWEHRPDGSTPYYSLMENSVFLPAATLPTFLFSQDFPKAYFYGYVAATAGHELAHGFSTIGLKYDAQGNMRNICSCAVTETLGSKSSCFVDRYNVLYSEQEIQADGQGMLDESLSDNLGLLLGYRAYKAAGDVQETRLAGLDISGDKLFFLAYSQTKCLYERNDYSVTYNTLTRNSMGVYRVNEPVANSREFALVFGCQPDTAMNPSEKCQVW